MKGIYYLNEVKRRFERVEKESKELTAEGVSGDDAVVVMINGHLEVLSVKIEPSLMNPGDLMLLEGLVGVAFAKATESMRAMIQIETMTALLALESRFMDEDSDDDYKELFSDDDDLVFENRDEGGADDDSDE